MSLVGCELGGERYWSKETDDDSSGDDSEVRSRLPVMHLLFEAFSICIVFMSLASGVLLTPAEQRCCAEYHCEIFGMPKINSWLLCSFLGQVNFGRLVGLAWHIELWLCRCTAVPLWCRQSSY